MTIRKSGAQQIDFPAQINDLAQKFKDERTKEREAKRTEKLEKEEENRRIRAQRLKDGLVYAKKIFDWAEAFRKSEVGCELMAKSHPPTMYHNIFFFDGRVEGTAWLGFVVSPEGLSLDGGGRYYSALSRQQIKSDRELAASVDTRILKMVCDWIDGGQVWECIEKRFDYLKDRQ